MKKRILFLCTGNSCRSQMAEGWARHLAFDKADFFSAGIEKHGLNPRAVTVMREAGVDISHHESQTLNDFNAQFDTVISVCDHARETCPHIPGANLIHIPFDDPPNLSRNHSKEEDILNIYRRVRDEIHTRLSTELPVIIG